MGAGLLFVFTFYTGNMGYSYSGVDLRRHPERYRIGRGEQGVFHAGPCKSELLPLWRYGDEAVAGESADAIHGKFREYRAEGDFVGMDAGVTPGTRTSRKANRAGKDPEKARAARDFQEGGAQWSRTKGIIG